ncbi:PAS domain-containing protein [Streptomyces klenkii]|uniref:PAS domain-containing protein n=1 Tax=Streptomyces klenkii TaxID=1420899 RepID=UPI0034101A75
MTCAEDEAASAAVWRGRFVSLLDRVPVPLAISDAYGNITGVNPAFAGVWSLQPGTVEGRTLLDLFTPTNEKQLHRLDEALRAGRRSRYPVEVCWAVRGAIHHGQVTVEPVSDPLDGHPHLLVTLRPEGERTGPSHHATARPDGPEGAEQEFAHLVLSAQEARILPLVAAGATTSVMARTVGISVDGINYHLTRLCRRLEVPNRPALVARAYVLGLLDPAAWPPRVMPPAAPRGGPAAGRR